jgi:hypothetical protein
MPLLSGLTKKGLFDIKRFAKTKAISKSNDNFKNQWQFQKAMAISKNNFKNQWQFQNSISKKNHT